MAYILRNFDRVSVTASFEEMGRNNVDLGTCFRLLRVLSKSKTLLHLSNCVFGVVAVFEVLRRRNQKR